MRAKEAKRRLVEAGLCTSPLLLNPFYYFNYYSLYLIYIIIYIYCLSLTSIRLAPSKPTYENGAYHTNGTSSAGGQNNSVGPLSNNTQGSIHLSDFSLSSTTDVTKSHDLTKSHDPTKSYDHTRSLTNDALRYIYIYLHSLFSTLFSFSPFSILAEQTKNK